MVRYSQSSILGHTKKFLEFLSIAQLPITFFGSWLVPLINYTIGPSTLNKLHVICFCLAAEWNVYRTILKQFQLEVLKQNSRSRLCLYIVYSYCSAWAHNATAWLNLLPTLIVTVSCMHAVKYGNAFMCTRPMLSPLKHQHIDALITKVVALPLNTVTLLASIAAVWRW